jgi:arginyl-tRNA synthetase
MLPHKFIESRLQAAVRAVLPEANTSAVLVRPCPDPKFGDYQSNALMALARERKLNPRQLAADVLAKLDVSECCEKVEIAGAGFLNFRLKEPALAGALESAARGEHLFFEKTAAPRIVVIDFSSPNVAKPMHVGHIRSTILGDSLARTMRLLGYHVITDNHIGDWGTQFGKLIVGWKIAKLAKDYHPNHFPDPIGELERMYKEINAACEGDETVLKTLASKLRDSPLEIAQDFVGDKEHILAWARKELVLLQDGNLESQHVWSELITISQTQFEAIYGRLGVKFDHAYGESFYNSRLKGVVRELVDQGIARESEGAICVFSDGSLPPKQDPFLKQEDGGWQPNPFIIQKSDGAANYATTDLATLAFRLEAWHPDEIVYVTDGRQQLHFQQLFAVFRRWHPAAPVKLAHVWFGSILGDDGKPFKTRSGDTVKLADLLDEAEERAFNVVSEKNPELPEAQCREIARVVGLGAVKYADLVPNRQSDYVFSWDKMLALNGNTAPYLQYAYARIQSIFRKASAETPAVQSPSPSSGEKEAISITRKGEPITLLALSPPLGEKAGMRGGDGSTEQPTNTRASEPIHLTAPAEIAVARHLLNFGLALEAVAEEYRPNYLCNYLYELAANFARFYENCPVLKAEPAERASRLALCDLSGRVLKQGLEVLGIETLEQM